MTTRHVVADDILGKITRKVWELFRRILEGTIDHERTSAMLQLTLQGTPSSEGEVWIQGSYILETHWSWDKSHREFISRDIELHNFGGEEKTPDEIREAVFEWYRAIRRERGGGEIVRLYRVLWTDYFGLNTFQGIHGTLTRDIVEAHVVLLPICEFREGEPIPISIERKRK